MRGNPQNSVPVYGTLAPGYAFSRTAHRDARFHGIHPESRARRRTLAAQRPHVLPDQLRRLSRRGGEGRRSHPHGQGDLPAAAHRRVRGRQDRRLHLGDHAQRPRRHAVVQPHRRDGSLGRRELRARTAGQVSGRHGSGRPARRDRRQGAGLFADGTDASVAVLQARGLAGRRHARLSRRPRATVPLGAAPESPTPRRPARRACPPHRRRRRPEASGESASRARTHARRSHSRVHQADPSGRHARRCSRSPRSGRSRSSPACSSIPTAPGARIT